MSTRVAKHPKLTNTEFVKAWMNADSLSAFCRTNKQLPLDSLKRAVIMRGAGVPLKVLPGEDAERQWIEDVQASVREIKARRYK